MPISHWPKRVFEIASRLSAGRAASRLRRDTNMAGRLLGEVLQETLQNQVTPQELEWVTRIEALRKDLSSSAATITFVDYGAGESNLALTDESMFNGRNVDRTIGDICQGSSEPYFWSLLLFKTVRKFKPVSCIEMGTCLGISTAFQAAALRLNGVGQVVSLEGAEALASLAKSHLQRLGLDNASVVTGRFQDTLDAVLKAQKPIDFIFIDGHHDEKATLAYFEQTMPFLAEGATLIFDDINWSSGMKRAWKAIAADVRVNISIDLRRVGVVIIDRRLSSKKSLTIPLIIV